MLEENPDASRNEKSDKLVSSADTWKKSSCRTSCHWNRWKGSAVETLTFFLTDSFVEEFILTHIVFMSSEQMLGFLKNYFMAGSEVFSEFPNTAATARPGSGKLSSMPVRPSITYVLNF